MRILITGATGFAGNHLVRFLRASFPQDEIHGTQFMQSDAGQLGVTLHLIDLRDAEAVLELLEQVRPDQIYHLAAQANVRQSFDDPWGTLETNIRSELNLFQACMKLSLRPRIVVTSTGELYANANRADRPADETTAPQPSSPYSVSKLAQELLGIQYFLSNQFPVLIARPFNQIGPGQREGFVVPDFAMQIARIEAGLQPPIIKVGNLEAQRDFTDVRDVARAKVMLMTSGEPGNIYNIASGKPRRIQEILDLLLQQSRVSIEVQKDPNRMRPANVPLLWGDFTKLSRATGWYPEITFEQSLSEVLKDCREFIHSHHQGVNS